MILGAEIPRIFTPPRRELSQQTSDGWAAIAFAELLLDIRLFPWQKWLLIHALELNPDFTYRFRTVFVNEARQNGKTLVMIVLALWHIYAKGSRTVIATAQDLSKSEDAWASAVEWAQGTDELSGLIEKVHLAHPKRLRVYNPSIAKTCEYRVATASRRGGRGFTGDLILLDELREHQSWDSWAAVVHTMMARPRAQCWSFSNAGDAMSIVWRYQRALAHRDLGWPDGDSDAEVLSAVEPDVDELLKELAEETTSGWFEWSAPPNARRTDRHAWGAANGSMNHTSVAEDCVTERAIAHALRTDPASVFDQEVLCRYTPFAHSGPFPEGLWEASVDAKATGVGESIVCVEISASRNRTYVGRAAVTAEGEPVVGIWESGQGTDWVVPWLAEHQDRFTTVLIRANVGSPALTLMPALAAAGLHVTEWKGADIGAAHGALFDAVRDGTVHHLPHPGLDAAATSAAIKLQAGGGWIIDTHKSPSDTAPLLAVIGATWGVTSALFVLPAIY